MHCGSRLAVQALSLRVCIATSACCAGSISSSFEARHDWQGRPRSIEVQGGGVVSADHGRCSDIGTLQLRQCVLHLAASAGCPLSMTFGSASLTFSGRISRHAYLNYCAAVSSLQARMRCETAAMQWMPLSPRHCAKASSTQWPVEQAEATSCLSGAAPS